MTRPYYSVGLVQKQMRAWLAASVGTLALSCMQAEGASCSSRAPAWSPTQIDAIVSAGTFLTLNPAVC